MPSEPSLDQLLDRAAQHHIAGEFGQAESLYQQILAQDQQHVLTTQNLGVLFHQIGQNERAIEFLRRAIALAPQRIDARINLANVLRATGRLAEAIARWREIIALTPELADPYLNLADALSQSGQFDESIAVSRQAIARWPTSAQAHNNLGIALKSSGETRQAIAAYRQAIICDPSLVEAHNNLGNALVESGFLDESIVSLRRAIELRPAYAEAYYNLSLAFNEKNQLDQAISACRQAIALKPNFAAAYGNLGVMLMECKQIDEAIVAYLRATELNPEFAEGFNNLGTLLMEKGRVVEAIALFRQAIAIRPDFLLAYHNLSSALIAEEKFKEGYAAAEHATQRPDYGEPHINLATIHLIRGDFARGWEEYEWRWKCAETPQPNFSQPQWIGEPLEGRTILLFCEQGFGDTMQFSRYWLMVAQRGGNIILQCQPALKRLLQISYPQITVVSQSDPLPAFDLYCPMLSLPSVFKTDLTNIPANVPHLHPDLQQFAVWRDRLKKFANKLKVGLAWRGNPNNKNDRNRSLALSWHAPLAQIPGVQFISLQKGSAAGEIETSPLAMVDWTNDLNDFADTAALVANLDLVISSDTAVAHLAGAMGKPVWVLLTHFPDWRWLLHRSDSPWYPTMRLFRQPTRGDWGNVIQSIHAGLCKLDPDIKKTHG